MNEQQTHLQVLGSIFIAILGALLFRIAAVKLPPVIYRQTIVLIATYMLVAVIVRTLVTLGIISQVDARVINGLVAGFYAATLLAMLIMARVEQHMCGKYRKEK